MSSARYSSRPNVDSGEDDAGSIRRAQLEEHSSAAKQSVRARLHLQSLAAARPKVNAIIPRPGAGRHGIYRVLLKVDCRPGAEAVTCLRATARGRANKRPEVLDAIVSLGL